jgi:hypothetical protein
MIDLIITLAIIFTFFGGIIVGVGSTADPIRDITRDKVVLYCIEKPDLCKEEYNHIKTQENLSNYKRPELGETK